MATGREKERKKRERDGGSDQVAARPVEPDVYLGKAVIPPDLEKPEKLERWKLPVDPDTPGEYMVELNLMHSGGLPAADLAFLAIYRTVVPPPREEPVRVGKTYYSCVISLNEVRQLVAADQKAAEDAHRPQDRAIYRMWPDFPVRGLIDRSIATIKADAALKSYEASGSDIVWAVIDSGIDAAHPHFGNPDDPHDSDKRNHTVLAKDVAELHRCFSRIRQPHTTVPIPRALPDPDTRPANTSPEQWEKERAELLRRHVANALTDEFGHGTHVAGIIAGGLRTEPEPSAAGGFDWHVYERTFEADPDGKQASKTIKERAVRDAASLRGVAPRCKLVSLRVLDGNGDGRASDIIRALEYVREKLNDNPKLLRVHGVNLSVGYEFDAEMFACGQSPLCVEVDRLVQSGVVVVAAAGNTGYGTLGADQRATKVGISNTINDPGNAAGAITVGATHRDSPHTYGVSYFSSKGPTADGRLKPDLVAPGERITSCAAGVKLKDLPLPGPAASAPAPIATGATPGQTASPGSAPGPVSATASPPSTATRRVACYIDDSGTSMAAPHVSGAIAAFLSIRREFIGKPAEVKRILLSSATSLGRERYFEGHGLVDLMRAIQSV